MFPARLTTVEFDTELAGPSVEDHGGHIVKLRRDVRRGGRAHAARAVGARRGDRELGLGKQRARDRMSR